MVDFIFMGLLDLWAAQTNNYIMQNSCTHWDSNTAPSAYKYSLSVVLLVEISIEYLNIDHILPECAIKLYLCRVPRGRFSKIFCRVLHLINSLQSANVLIKQTRYLSFLYKFETFKRLVYILSTIWKMLYRSIFSYGTLPWIYNIMHIARFKGLYMTVGWLLYFFLLDR